MAPAECAADTEHQQVLQPINAYEARRAETIARNRRKMAEMGVVDAVDNLQRVLLPESCKPKHCSFRKRPRPADEVASIDPARTSRRLQGLAVEATTALNSSSRSSKSSDSPGHIESSPSEAQRTDPAFELVADTQYVAPFTLLSIGVTVWDLGQLYRGAWQQNYWSSKGCKYHHAYPVGYTASKVVFNRTWKMTISSGETGPMFTVCDEAGHLCFKGNSPTKPWTDVCLAQRTGQRISGPQYYGFSDVLVQRAIAGMYTPEELERAQYGLSQVITVDGTQQLLSASERYAAELMTNVRGIGATTATVLATTTSLGGRHTCMADLTLWLAADNKHMEQLQNYLLNSPEMPNSSRHLPAWRNKWVPLIIQQLTQKCSAGDCP